MLSGGPEAKGSLESLGRSPAEADTRTGWGPRALALALRGSMEMLGGLSFFLGRLPAP